MPTVGWIQEDAIERFWENPYPPERNDPPAIPCPYCQRHFPGSEELFQHLGLDHPLEIPALQLRMQSVQTEFVVRTPFEAADIALLNCSKCEIRKDGDTFRQIQPSRVPPFLAGERSSTCELRLLNERALDHHTAVARYIARFCIPSTNALNIIDQGFVGQLALEHPRIADVAAFREACPEENEAQDYAGALGDYVIGLAIKERHPDSGVHAEFEHYKEKFTSALNVLKDFRRPVSRVVSAVINFNLNNFAVPPAPSRLPALSRAFAFFRAVASENEPPTQVSGHELQRAPVCPVDIVTHRILDATQRLSSERKPHPIVAANLEELGRWEPLSEYDASKIHVLSAIAHTRLGDTEKASRHYRALQFNFLFGKWAQARLETPLQHGNAESR